MVERIYKKAISIFLVFILNSFSQASELKDNVYHFTILKIYDENFLKLSDTDLNKVLQETKRILKKKLNQDVEFKIKKEVKAKEFIDEFIRKNKHCKNFLPPDLRKKIKTTADFINILEEIYLHNIEELKNLKDENGNLIFTKENIIYYSGFYWENALSLSKYIKLCEVEKYCIGIEKPEYDIYLINLPIINDFSFDLYLMLTGFIDGYQLSSNRILITTFPLLTDLKYFEKIKEVKDYETKLKLLSYLFASQIARNLTGVYSSYVGIYEGCLVDEVSPYKLRFEDKYKIIEKTDPCVREIELLREAKKRKIAEQYILEGKYQEAINIYEKICKNYPVFYQYLGCLYEKVGKIEEAIFAWQKFANEEKDMWILERINNHINELKEILNKRKKREGFEEKLNLKLFKEKFLSVFEKMVDYYWDESGDIKEDMMGDATGFAPYVLYQVGVDTQIEEFIEMANKVVNYEVELFKEIIPYLKEQKPHKNLLSAVSGSPALLDGYKYTGKEEYLEMIKEGLTISNEIAYNNPAYFSFFFEIPNVVEALVCYSDFLIYKETKDEKFLKLGLKLFEKIEKTWNQEKGYYGKRIKVTFDWMQGLVFLNLGLLYDITKDLKYKERADKMIESLDKMMWDEERGGYFSSDKKLNDTKSLSGNAIFIMGYLNLYEATGDIKYFEKAKKILEFLFTEDFYKDGILYHDWSKKYGRSNSFCTGCNYLILSNIYRLNKLILREGK
jgi:hypothetical protein